MGRDLTKWFDADLQVLHSSHIQKENDLKNYSSTTSLAVKKMISSFADETTYFTKEEKEKLK